jgi:hypothetical protein
LDDLERLGLIVRFGPRLQRLVAIHPALPARSEYLKLLDRIRRTYTPDAKRRSLKSLDPPPARAWHFTPLRFFGSWQQTEALIILSLVPEIDLTQLCDAIDYRHPDQQTIARVVRKLCHQQVLDHRRFGKFIMYRLSPNFAAAKSCKVS